MLKHKIVWGLAVLTIIGLGGCAKSSAENTSNNWHTIVKQAKKEGTIRSVGMPNSWANWGGTWDNIRNQYKIFHSDTDMSSAEALQKFKSEGTSKNAPDMSDIGLNVCPTAVKQNLLTKYKTKYWNQIPNWAKDKDGYWAAGYTGTIAFITDTKDVKASQAPKSWKQLAKGNYKVAIGDVGMGAQSQYALLAAAYANGGNEKNLKPGLNFFAKLKKENRISAADTTIQNLQKGELPVTVLWDFNALNYAHQINSKRYKITIPTDGTVSSGYAEVINKDAPHPYAAKLARSYILSNKGQINLAEGYARPIRKGVKLPESAKRKLLPSSDYKKVFHVKDNAAWDKVTLKLGDLWRKDVLGAK
ncbi:ABC transporter substrate-binding protein [Lentilactobacillus raoultii]|uniref:ABC transporter substrate-binding protein n=1 Tax=Lentilactobacillus raoultii TaxID=1987503 RepID=A0ABW3PHV4_9LACO|nr:ABC transporter substrate-binding protein [Lentilactobacillus raoultii]